MANCCPLPTAMTTIAATTCQFNLNEVHRIWAVREGNVIWNLSTPTSNVGAASGAVPTASTEWAVLKAATNSTKVVFAPLFGSEPKITPGGEISSTGLANRKNHVGYDPSDFSAFYEGLTSAQESNLADLTCEGETLEVYFILHDKTIVGQVDAATSNLFTGIPIESAILLLGRSLNGFNENDKNECQFQLLHNWSQNLHSITPASGFNTLTF